MTNKIKYIVTNNIWFIIAVAFCIFLFVFYVGDTGDVNYVFETKGNTSIRIFTRIIALLLSFAIIVSLINLFHKDETRQLIGMKLENYLYRLVAVLIIILSLLNNYVNQFIKTEYEHNKPMIEKMEKEKHLYETIIRKDYKNVD